MKLIRRSAWVAVMLGAAVGCSDENAGNTPANTGTPSPALAPKTPVVPAKGPAEGAKDAGTKEMQPPAGKTDESKKPEESKKSDGSPTLEGPKTEPGKADTAAVKLTPDELANIKKLPAADQELAIKQGVCLVSGEHLGEMGKPEKITIEGRTAFLCCENCEKEVKADPKKYLAKLDALTGKK